MDQPGKVSNPARGQLNRENNIPLSPCVPENLVSRDGFSRPVPRQYVPTTEVVLKQPSQSIHTSREENTFRRRFRILLFIRGAPVLVGEQQILKWYHHLQKVQSLLGHNYIPFCTVYTVEQQSVLVDYGCFHLTSGASTANIVGRNRNRLLPSKSTLREEFAEKRYQVFDISSSWKRLRLR